MEKDRVLGEQLIVMVSSKKMKPLYVFQYIELEVYSATVELDKYIFSSELQFNISNFLLVNSIRHVLNPILMSLINHLYVTLPYLFSRGP